MAPCEATQQDELQNNRKQNLNLRFIPSIPLDQQLFVNVLAHGYNFDQQSVNAVIKDANLLFEQREWSNAINAYGLAYELARMQLMYAPLMHDILQRRILCNLLLGNLDQAQQEVDLAQQVIPRVPTTLLLAGILKCRQGEDDAANDLFQLASVLDNSLCNAVDCIVGFTMLQRGFNDRATLICNDILGRTAAADEKPMPLALLLRAEAYRLHPSGCFGQQADADLAALKGCSTNAEPPPPVLNSDGVANYEELLLHFRVREALNTGPKLSSSYPCYESRFLLEPFYFAVRICRVIAKLRVLAKSSRLLRAVQEEHSLLLQQCVSAEHRVREIVELQRHDGGTADSLNEVWGPNEREDASGRKYRRYWMERPMSFPMRPRSRPASASGRRLSKANSVPFDEVSCESRCPSQATRRPSSARAFGAGGSRPFRKMADGESSTPSQGVRPPSASMSKTRGRAEDLVCRGVSQQREQPVVPPQEPRVPFSPAPQQKRPGPLPAAPPPLQQPPLPHQQPPLPQPQPQPPAAPSVTQSSPSTSVPLLSQRPLLMAGAAAPPPVQPVAPPPAQPDLAALLHEPPAAAAVKAPSLPASSTPSVAAAPPSAAPTPASGGCLQSGAKPSAQAVAPPPCSAPPADVKVKRSAGETSQDSSSSPAQVRAKKHAPYERIGSQWTDKQWILKAQEIVEVLAAHSAADAGKVAGSLDTYLRSDPRSVGLSHSVPHAQVGKLTLDEPVSNTVVLLEGKEVCLVKAVEQVGFVAIPAWFGAVDQIFEVSDMFVMSGADQVNHADRGKGRATQDGGASAPPLLATAPEELAL
eukprot:CAMPEP_0178390252 /NCGR_PEP_ID=MMETSP0689_2-20121128/10549_1 /TAXON_ID=160604 /ORGANISM="Amphidinium massartii, Strain CS-259" /LENGTH=813 /DNA_ID=CAMNT_0020010753 /DNA_START=57 /DNA_END=2499 /DNA_ORIENTATION=-